MQILMLLCAQLAAIEKDLVKQETQNANRTGKARINEYRFQLSNYPFRIHAH